MGPHGTLAANPPGGIHRAVSAASAAARRIRRPQNDGEIRLAEKSGRSIMEALRNERSIEAATREETGGLQSEIL